MADTSLIGAYAAHRARFLAAAMAAGADIETIAHPLAGPDGGAIGTDLAWIGPRDAAAVLVLVSGTHGVEGLCGSLVQAEWLERGEAARLPNGLAALLIHGNNPHGFAWLRRVTEDNVDLNRNWIDFAKPLPENPGYEALAAAISPVEWTAASQSASAAVFADYVAAQGQAAFMAAVSTGQYRHADGLFFGGTAPTWSRRTLSRIFSERLAAAAHIGIIDIHTGLGPPGYGEPIVVMPPGHPGCDRALAWHGLAATPVHGPGSVSAAIGGDWLSAVPALVPGTVTGIALEFGTQPPAAVVDALRADNWLHRHGDPLSSDGAAIKRQMVAAFYGDSDIWRGMVIGQTMLAARQTVAGLARAL